MGIGQATQCQARANDSPIASPSTKSVMRGSNTGNIEETLYRFSTVRVKKKPHHLFAPPERGVGLSADEQVVG